MISSNWIAAALMGIALLSNIPKSNSLRQRIEGVEAGFMDGKSSVCMVCDTFRNILLFRLRDFNFLYAANCIRLYLTASIPSLQIHKFHHSGEDCKMIKIVVATRVQMHGKSTQISRAKIIYMMKKVLTPSIARLTVQLENLST